jgi:hypothetical protein
MDMGETVVINLVNGAFQNSNGQPLAWGSIVFQLAVDGRVLAAPYGFVSKKEKVVFQLDGNGNLITPCAIWSSLELAPQLSPTLLGAVYNVTLYTQSGARVSGPMQWLFPNVAGNTIDIGQMIAIQAFVD